MVGHGRNICMVKVETEGGHFGWGESGVVGREVPSPHLLSDPSVAPLSRGCAMLVACRWLSWARCSTTASS